MHQFELERKRPLHDWDFVILGWKYSLFKVYTQKDSDTWAWKNKVIKPHTEGKVYAHGCAIKQVYLVSEMCWTLSLYVSHTTCPTSSQSWGNILYTQPSEL